uniref:Endonuclease/exonuclease/phosphatase domain-containing protein n=1 Tax=Plectus sambesii TaxID=2011161 RepID=A0A914X0I3_9BILA
MRPEQLLAAVLCCAIGIVVVEGKVLQNTPANIRILTFNIWNSGQNVQDGLLKIAKHIKLVDPDIVALQEVEDKSHFDSIVTSLGAPWKGFYHDSSYPDTGIITKHEIVDGSQAQAYAAVGAKVKVTLKTNDAFSKPNTVIVNFWSLHLDWRSYGPYAACNKLVTDASQIMAGEMNLGVDAAGRVQNVRDILSNSAFKQAILNSNREPLIVGGDFNAPSHLDWTEATKNDHCGWEFPWPSTKLIIEESGLQDSFRELYPNPETDPGVTWSTVQTFTDQGWGWTVPEPQDRIDMILYRSKRLIPRRSYTYKGTEPVHRKPNHFQNDYPSDHYAVVTDFEYIDGAQNMYENDDNLIDY